MGRAAGRGADASSRLYAIVYEREDEVLLKTEYGVRLPNSGPFASAENVLRAGERAEALGFDSVWVHDHISWGRDKLTHFAAGSVEACAGKDPNFLESMTTAVALGSRLQRTKIGIAGMILPLRDPRILGKQIATTDQLIGPNRLTVAFGVGAMANDFAVMGVPMNRRGRIANDHIGALRAILGDAQPVDYESPSVAWSDGTFLPQPSGVALWVVGRSEAAQRRAATFGDGWLASPGKGGSLETFGASVRRLEAILEDQGRSRDTFTVGLEIFTSIAKSRQAAVASSQKSLVERFGSVEEGEAATLLGDAERIAEDLLAYHLVGARQVEFKFICHSMDEMFAMMEEMAEIVETVKTNLARMG